MNRPVTPNQSRLPPSSPAGHHDDKVNKAALKGASLAFKKSMPKLKPNTATPTQSPDNRALIAATSASRDHSLSRPPTSAKTSRVIKRQTTGSSVLEQQSSQHSSQHSSQQSSQQSNASQHLGPPGRHAMADPRSPSFIAATLAVSRSGTPSPNHPPQSHPYSQQTSRRPQNGSTGGYSAANSVASLDLATDTASIPSTNALISMFEKRDGDDTDPVKKAIAAPDNYQLPGISSNKLRPMTPPRTMSPVAKNDVSPSRLASARAWERAASASPPASVKEVAQERARRPPNITIESKKRPPTPPPARTKNEVEVAGQSQALQSRGKPRATTPPPKQIKRSETEILSPQPRRTASQKILLEAAEEPTGKDRRPPAVKPKPQRVIPLDNIPEPITPANESLQRSTVTQPLRSSSTISNDTFVSASSAPSPLPDSPHGTGTRPPTPDTVRLSSTRPLSAQTTSTSARRGRPSAGSSRWTGSNLPLESLTNAMVAGSLASARMTPTTVYSPPPPPAQRRTPHMRQTLRQPPNKSDDEDSRARSHHRKPLGKLGGGNKHSHHEGARKRWREEITARERKRYEGVWASNRGLWLEYNKHRGGGSSGGSSGELVANVVVRDIWARSRLPFDELAEVWDLVDNDRKGTLDRTEFVVGMWLIDQRLRGRKIPRKVTDSVWGSAKGVRVLGPKHKHHKK
ncbi:hypothetical protein F5B20DRAFT_520055 [Whalleya microplaca]|nr:hypothetical protein F5B20DRAFT_520055 [Whalleya microplaca]